MKKLSVIVPSYDEENRITETLEDIDNTLKGQSFDYEIIVVNDGSKDKTVKVVKELSKKIPKISLIDNETNHGKGWVTKQGILSATGDVRLFMDADNSTKVSEVFNMLPYLDKGYDVIVGSRCVEGSKITVKQSRVRVFLGWVLRKLIHILIPLGVVDSQCGFKVFSEKAVNIIFPKQTIFRWTFDIEILKIASRNKLKIKEMPISWTNNTESHIRFSGMISMLYEIFKMRFNMPNIKKIFIKVVKKILSYIPKKIIVGFYNFANKFAVFEYLTNSIIKKLIPDSIQIPEGRIFLNKDDVGVSGHLALGVYEKTEIDLFRNSIKESDVVVDIGANIGYYSVIAGKKLGDKGKLFVYEPEEVNLNLLKKNIEHNKIQNVIFEQTALSNEVGTKKFFLTKHNKGTHSLVNNRGVVESVLVKTDTLDNSLKKYGSPKVDVIKMDIEGAEIMAIEGMLETIKKSQNLIIFTEFYPKAIRRLNQSPIAYLNRLVELGFSLKLIDEEKGAMVDLENFEDFIDSFPNSEFVRNIYAIKG